MELCPSQAGGAFAWQPKKQRRALQLACRCRQDCDIEIWAEDKSMCAFKRAGGSKPSSMCLMCLTEISWVFKAMLLHYAKALRVRQRQMTLIFTIHVARWEGDRLVVSKIRVVDLADSSLVRRSAPLGGSMTYRSLVQRGALRGSKPKATLEGARFNSTMRQGFALAAGLCRSCCAGACMRWWMRCGGPKTTLHSTCF